MATGELAGTKNLAGPQGAQKANSSPYAFIQSPADSTYQVRNRVSENG